MTDCFLDMPRNFFIPIWFPCLACFLIIASEMMFDRLIDWLIDWKYFSKLFFPGCIAGILAGLAYLQKEGYFKTSTISPITPVQSHIETLVQRNETGSDAFKQINQSTIFTAGAFPKIIDAWEELGKVNSSQAETCDLNDRRRDPSDSTAAWTFRRGENSVDDRFRPTTETDDFKRWVASFFPQPTPFMSDKEVFLGKVVGLREFSVCRQPTDELDFSAGIAWRWTIDRLIDWTQKLLIMVVNGWLLDWWLGWFCRIPFFAVFCEVS